jgi:uncharacterized OB-fold protein
MAHIPLPLYASRIPQRYSMMGARCKNCRKVTFPPSRMCDCIANVEYEEIKLSGQGKIYAYTIISVGPPEFAEQQKLTGKYGIAIIELEEGPRIVAQLTDCNPEDMKIGTEVRAVFRRIYEEEGVIRYGLKFKPIETNA